MASLIILRTTSEKEIWLLAFTERIDLYILLLANKSANFFYILLGDRRQVINMDVTFLTLGKSLFALCFSTV